MKHRFEVNPPARDYAGMTTLYIGDRVIKCMGVGKKVERALLAKAKAQ